MFDAGKTRMIGLPYGEKNYDDMLSRLHLIPERYGQTDRQTDGHMDGRTDLRVSMLRRGKNESALAVTNRLLKDRSRKSGSIQERCLTELATDTTRGWVLFSTDGVTL